MKNILMLGTGGTIASEMTPDGLTPELTPQQLLRYVPAISTLCRVDCKSLFSLASTNITPAHWIAVAQALRDNYAHYDGFILLLLRPEKGCVLILKQKTKINYL